MTSSLPRGNSIITPTLNDQRIRVNELETLKILKFQDFKQMIRSPNQESDILILEVVIVLFRFKEVSLLLLEKIFCSSTCEKVPCLLKDLLKKVLAVGKTYSSEKISTFNLFRVFHELYLENCSIQSSFDIFQCFLHSFSTSGCLDSVELDLNLKLNNVFSCVCGKKKEIANEVNYLAVQVSSYSEFISDPLQRVFKNQLRDPLFAVCLNPRCEHKKSRSMIEITQLPSFIAFKFVWNDDFDSNNFVLDSIKNEFNISEFSKTLKGLFKISIIFLQNELIFNENGIWSTRTIKYNSLDLLLKYLKSKNGKIFAVVYSKIAEGSHSASSTLTTENQESFRTPATSNKCIYCKAPSLQLCKCQELLCKYCKNAISTSNGSCFKCLRQSETKSPDVKYSTFNGNKCLKCNKNYVESGFCITCKLDSSDSLKEMKTAVLSTNCCKTCLKDLREAYCASCDSLCHSAYCLRCQGKSGFECVKCRNERKAKRNLSNFNVRKKCGNCNKTTLDSELVCFYCHKNCNGRCFSNKSSYSPSKKVCKSCISVRPTPPRIRK